MSRIRVFNPRRAANPRPQIKQSNPQAGRSELLARIRELQTENDQLQDTLDKVADLAAAPADGSNETYNELVDKLNDVIDTVAPPEGDEDQSEAEDDDRGED